MSRGWSRGRRVAGRDGYAIPLALVVLLVASAAASLLAAALSLEMRQARREAAGIALVMLADAAVAETLAHLAADPGFAGVASRRLGDGEISSRVESLPGLRRLVVASARLAGRGRTVEVVVEMTANGPIVVQWARRRPG